MSELSPEEIEFLRGFVKGVCSPYSILDAAWGENAGRNLSQLNGWSSILVSLGKELGGYAEALSGVARDLGNSYVRDRLYKIASVPEVETTKASIDLEIGAMKSHVDQAVTQINEALASVQSVINELKEQKDLFEIARTVDSDPLYGTM